MKECALHTFLSMPKERQTVYRGRLGIWYEVRRGGRVESITRR